MLSGMRSACTGVLVPATWGHHRNFALRSDEKLQLEREWRNANDSAVLGQMAASISHNLKNPLGSIKTILTGADGKSRSCRTPMRGLMKRRWCWGNRAIVREVESVAAIQPSGGARWNRGGHLRREGGDRRSDGSCSATRRSGAKSC